MWRPRHGIALATTGLLGLGVIMSQSAGLDVGRGEVQSALDVLAGPAAVRAACAMLIFAACSFVPTQPLAESGWRRPWVPVAVAGSLGLLLLLFVPGIGAERNGAVRWIAIGPGFQPSEIAKWVVPIGLAWWAAGRGRHMERLGSGLLPGLLVLGGFAILIGAEDLGTAAVIGLVGLVVLVAGGARPKFLLAAAPVAAALAVVAVVLEPYRLRRLVAFVDPYGDPENANFHVVQSLAAMAGGGPSGRGLGNGTQKFGYLPEDTTDFVFSIVCEELGLAGAAIVTFLIGLVVVSAAGVARRTHEPFERLAVLAVAATFGVQAVVNLLVVTGLAPTKGIALPFVSHGGTGWWVTAAALGLLAAIDRRADRGPRFDSPVPVPNARRPGRSSIDATSHRPRPTPAAAR